MIEWLSYGVLSTVIMLPTIMLFNKLCDDDKGVTRIGAAFIALWYLLLGEIGFWSAVVCLVLVIVTHILFSINRFFIKKDVNMDWWKKRL